MHSTEDLIFVAGAPGSRWSSVARAISYAAEVNHTDEDACRSYGGPAELADVTPGHFGNYFGPGMEFGADFERLHTLPVPELRAELLRPFARPGGVLLLKSHYFARHLPYLAEAFPGARFLLVHRDDEACLEWWRTCGGFDIPYPRYDHYRDMEGIRAAIEADNAGILAYAAARGVPLRNDHRLTDLTAQLGLRLCESSMAERAACDAEAEWLKALPGGDLTEKLDRVLATASTACV